MTISFHPLSSTKKFIAIAQFWHIDCTKYWIYLDNIMHTVSCTASLFVKKKKWMPLTLEGQTFSLQHILRHIIIFCLSLVICISPSQHRVCDPPMGSLMPFLFTEIISRKKRETCMIFRDKSVLIPRAYSESLAVH